MKTFKTLFNTLKKLLILVTITALFTTCGIVGNNDDDDCKNDVNTEIERIFKPTVIVNYKDGKPFEGFVEFEIFKQYCDGYMPTNGKYTQSGATNSDGYWNVGYTYIYKFKYDLDFVYVKIRVGEDDSQGLWLEDEIIDRYYYSDVTDQSSIPTNYSINLSWSSTD